MDEGSREWEAKCCRRGRRGAICRRRFVVEAVVVLPFWLAVVEEDLSAPLTERGGRPPLARVAVEEEGAPEDGKRWEEEPTLSLRSLLV